MTNHEGGLRNNSPASVFRSSRTWEMIVWYCWQEEEGGTLLEKYYWPCSPGLPSMGEYFPEGKVTRIFIHLFFIKGEFVKRGRN